MTQLIENPSQVLHNEHYTRVQSQSNTCIYYTEGVNYIARVSAINDVGTGEAIYSEFTPVRQACE